MTFQFVGLTLTSMLYVLVMDLDAGKQLELHEVYKVSTEQSFEILSNRLANYHVETREIKLTNEMSFIWDRRGDLRGKHLKVGYVENPPFVNVMKDKHGNLVSKFILLILSGESLIFNDFLSI